MALLPSRRVARVIPVWTILLGLGLTTACGGSRSQRTHHAEGQPAAQDTSAAEWRRTVPEPTAPQGFDYPIPEVAELENGLTLYVLPEPKPVISAALVLRRGSAADPKGQSGLAALTARMLTEGTKELNAEELAATVEDFGSEMHVGTSQDSTSLGFRFLAEDLQAAIQLMSDVFTKSSFAPDTFERVRREWLDSLKRQRQEPAALASIVGLRASLPSALGEPTSGGVSSVKSLTIEDLRSFHQQQYRPDATLLVVAGASLADVRGAAASTLGAWTGTKGKAVPPEPGEARVDTAGHQTRSTEPSVARAGAFKKTFAKAWFVDRPGAAQSALFVSCPLPKRSVPGYEVRELVNQVLGGMFTSRMNQNLREKHGYTYGAYSSNYATKNFGLWVLRTSVRTEVTHQALEEILNELGSLAEGQPVTQAELSRARQELLGSYAESLELGSDMIDEFAGTFVDGLPSTYLSTLNATLERVQLADLKNEISQFTTPSPLLVVVGDKAKIGDALRQVAPSIADAPPHLLD